MNETPKHTPGPWHRTGSNYVARTGNDGTGVVCKTSNTVDALRFCAGPGSLEDAANAALIAAAPDLLAACEAALKALKNPKK